MSIEESTPAELVELLRAEQRRLWLTGERVATETYFARHPRLLADETCALKMVYNEVLLREAEGDGPRLEDYVRRFPQYADQLAPLFEVHRALEADQRLAAAAGETPSERTARPGEPETACPWPAVAGHEIIGELGRGGMGVVYQARQVGLNRVVALKMILAGNLADPGRLARFRAEAEAVALLQHPNIVQVYDVGEQDGRPYFSLEFIDGGSLADALNGTPRPARQAAELVRTLALAVQHAHERGIVHRDLKPANILLQKTEVRCQKSEGGADGRLPSVPCLLSSDFCPKITDFGLAKLLAGGSDARTHSGQILGTPDYMAPEQAGGGSKHVGPAADVYALGAVLYELLTGRPPFKGESLQETLLQVLTADPVPPSRLRLKTPRDLETVTLKCLAKDPARRYPSALALAEDLRRFLAGEPTAARPLGRAGRLGRWCRRNPAVASLSSVLLLTLLGGLAALTALYLHARRQQLLAETRAREVISERDRAEENFRMALGAVEKYLTNVGDSAELKAHGLEQLRRRLLGEAREFFERFVHDRSGDPALLADLGRAYSRLAYISDELGDNAQAIELYGRARDLFTALVADRPDAPECRELLAVCLTNRGNAYTVSGQWAEADASLKAAREGLEQLGREHPDSPQYPAQAAAACRSLSGLYDQMGRRDDQEKCDRAALEICTSLARQHPDVPDYHADAAKSLGNLGLLYSRTDRPPEAEEAFRESLRICERLARDHSDALAYRGALARCHVDLGVFYYKAGRYSEGQASCLAARKLLAKLVREHPYVLRYLDDAATNELNLGASYFARGQRDEAASAYEEARRGFARLAVEVPASPMHQLSLASACNNLGNTAYMMGQFPRAEAAYAEARKALETLTRLHPQIPEYQSGLAMTLNNLGNVYRELGRPAEAESALREALKAREVLVRQHGGDVNKRQKLATTHNNLASLYAATGQFDKAEKAYDEACRGLEQLRHDHPGPSALAVDLAVAYHGRGLFALQRDRPEDAHAWQTRAITTLGEVLQKDQGNAAVGEQLRDAHEARAEAAARLGRLPDAERDWERALQLDGGGLRDAIRVRRALVLARRGEHARPVAEATEIARGKGSTGERFYDLACVYSLSSAAARQDARLAEGERTALAERYALLALETLTRARTEGYFKGATAVEQFKKDADMEPLRAREDFRKLLTELEKGGGGESR